MQNICQTTNSVSQVSFLHCLLGSACIHPLVLITPLSSWHHLVQWGPASGGVQPCWVHLLVSELILREWCFQAISMEKNLYNQEENGDSKCLQNKDFPWEEALWPHLDISPSNSSLYNSFLCSDILLCCLTDAHHCEGCSLFPLCPHGNAKHIALHLWGVLQCPVQWK